MLQEESLLTTVRNLILPLVAAAILAGCGGGGSSMATPVVMHTPPPSGTLATATLNGAPGFVDAAQRTVYVFDADLAHPSHSVCNGECAANWPHVGAPAGVTLVAPFSSIMRDDGSVQLTYAGRPLYTFVVDTAPGQTNGDGVDAFGGLWHIARPH